MFVDWLDNNDLIKLYLFLLSNEKGRKMLLALS